MATSSDYATRREPHEASVGEGSLAHLFGAPFLSRVWPDSDELNQDLRRRILAPRPGVSSRATWVAGNPPRVASSGAEKRVKCWAGGCLLWPTRRRANC